MKLVAYAKINFRGKNGVLTKNCPTWIIKCLSDHWMSLEIRSIKLKVFWKWNEMKWVSFSISCGFRSSWFCHIFSIFSTITREICSLKILASQIDWTLAENSVQQHMVEAGDVVEEVKNRVWVMHCTCIFHMNEKNL